MLFIKWKTIPFLSIKISINYYTIKLEKITDYDLFFSLKIKL